MDEDKSARKSRVTSLNDSAFPLLEKTFKEHSKLGCVPVLWVDSVIDDNRIRRKTYGGKESEPIHCSLCHHRICDRDIYAKGLRRSSVLEAGVSICNRHFFHVECAAFCKQATPVMFGKDKFAGKFRCPFC